MKAWLCLIPAEFKITVMEGVTPIETPMVLLPSALALLAVFKTKKDARKIFGKKAPLREVDVPPIQEKPNDNL